MSFIKKDYVKDFVVRLTVSRPEVLNALNIDVIQELDDSLKDCINDDKVGVIILTGER
jgi:Enoyl-CoA hydratase/carnithine racemase